MTPSQQFQVSKLQLQATLKDETRQYLQQAVETYEEAEGALSITQAVGIYKVSKITLYNKINSHRNQVLYITSKQRLTPEKKESFQTWVLKLQS